MNAQLQPVGFGIWNLFGCGGKNLYTWIIIKVILSILFCFLSCFCGFFFF